MKRLNTRWIILFLLIASAIFLIWRYTQPEPIEVFVKPVDRGTVEQTVANTRAGTVKACRRAKLSPSIGGQIAKLPIREGDIVKAGQLLLELWNKDLAAQVTLSESEAESAKARAKAACFTAEIAQREADRLLALQKTGAAPEEKVDKAVTEAKALSADCDAAKALVLMSKAGVGVARANLARTRLTAPFEGVVAEINGELNEYVTPSPVGIVTPPAVDLIDDSCFYVAAPIDEVDASAITVGMDARLTLDAFGEQRFTGKVRRIADFVMDREKQARTVDVEVEFANPAGTHQFLAGYSADVEIILEVRRKTLRIPTEAVLDGKRVFVYRPDRKIIKERIIKSGLSNWNYTEVLSGLDPDELVVINVDRSGIKDNANAVVTREEP